jgi:nitrogen permease regulator 3-like protein
VSLQPTNSAISSLPSNTFFAAVVRSKDLIPVYTNVVLWLLKRDMLITLHLRVRIVVTAEIKAKVRMEMERERIDRAARLGGDDYKTSHNGDRRPQPRYISLSPRRARRLTRRPSEYERSLEMNGFTDYVKSTTEGGQFDDVKDEMETEQDDEDDAEGAPEEDLWDAEDTSWATLISDPARATALQRRWLAAMSDGKDWTIARRFDR